MFKKENINNVDWKILLFYFNNKINIGNFAIHQNYYSTLLSYLYIFFVFFFFINFVLFSKLKRKKKNSYNNKNHNCSQENSNEKYFFCKFITIMSTAIFIENNHDSNIPFIMIIINTLIKISQLLISKD